MTQFIIIIATLLCNNFALLFYNDNSVYFVPMVVHTCPRCLMCPHYFYVLFLFMFWHVLCVLLPHMSNIFTWSICKFWATHQGVQYFEAETFACQKIRKIFDKKFRVWQFLELISRTAKIQEKNFIKFELFTVKTKSASTIVSSIRDIYNNKYIKVSLCDLRV